MKKYPSRIQEDLREKHTKSLAYDVARTGVMDVLQHANLGKERERELDRLHAPNTNCNFLRRMKH